MDIGNTYVFGGVVFQFVADSSRRPVRYRIVLLNEGLEELLIRKGVSFAPIDNLDIDSDPKEVFADWVMTWPRLD